MSATVNISAYKFISLDDLPALRERVLECCSTLGVKGTVLLAPEGINVFLAGSRGQIDAFMAWLHADHRFADVMPKDFDNTGRNENSCTVTAASLPGAHT
ncbi:MAG: hypothetical protein WDW38_010373 [Sanguina aurantia]